MNDIIEKLVASKPKDIKIEDVRKFIASFEYISQEIFWYGFVVDEVVKEHPDTIYIDKMIIHDDIFERIMNTIKSGSPIIVGRDFGYGCVIYTPRREWEKIYDLIQKQLERLK